MAMKIFRNLFERLSGERWKVTQVVADVDDIPNQLARREIILVATSQFTKWIVFDCPCGTGHRIMLNADSSREPTWELRRQDLAVLWPSVDYRGHRRCHYVICNGRTLWTKDSD